MTQQASIEELKQLPSVGETTARTLRTNGYLSFADLIEASPTALHRECDIVLSSTTHIISAAVEHVKGECPDCTHSDFVASWQSYNHGSTGSDDGDISCENCSWQGEPSDLNV